MRLKFSELTNFTPKQLEATRAADAYKYMLFGGSRGPGKSYWLRWYAVRLLLKWAGMGHKGVRVMLASEDYPSLYERQISKVEAEFPEWLGSYHKSRNEFRLHKKYGGGAIAFRNLDDPSKYQSAEFAAILVEEITKNPERTFHILRGSLRWAGIEDVKFIGACNPEPNWVRDYWITKNLPPEMQAERDKFVFVPALPTDNPHLTQSYWDMLETLPPALQAAWLRGDWFAIVEGLVYGNDFSQENIVDREPLDDVPFEVSFDDGYVDPRAILFIQRTGTEILVFDEVYHSYKLSEESIQEMLLKCLQWTTPEKREAAEAEIQEERERLGGVVENIKISQTLQRHGIRIPELAVGSSEAVELMKRFRHADIAARGGTHKVVEGIKQVRQLFKDGKGYRTVKVHQRCTHLIEEITQGYKYPEPGKRQKDNDKPQDGNDHALDSFRYWVWLRAGRT